MLIHQPLPPKQSPPYNFRLLFLDLDGTLIGKEDIPSPRTVAAILAAKEAGCTVVVCTGRNRHAVEPISAHWQDRTGYGIYCNGAVIWNLDTGRTLHKLTLDPDMVRRAASLAHDFGLAPLCYGVNVERDGGESIYTDRVCPVDAGYQDLYGYRLRFSETALEVPGIAEALSPVDMGVYGPTRQVRPLMEAWRGAFGGTVNLYDCAEQRIGPDGWGAWINHLDSDKVHAARWVTEQLSIRPEQVLAIGDEMNDRRLLEWAGLGVCMGDGHPEVMACAGHVTASLAEDGAALAIERFILGW